MLESVRPDALVLLGRHEGESIRLERVALNLDDAASADEDGERRIGAPILPAGPVGHWSTLPLDAFAAALASRALPFAWSHDAGGFLCNHAFYVARHWVERSGRPIPCGFVHLPPLEALALERQVEGVRACLARCPPSGRAGRSRTTRRARRPPAAARGTRCGSRRLRRARSGRSRC